MHLQVVELVKALVTAQYGSAATTKSRPAQFAPAVEQCMQHVAPSASGTQAGVRHEAAAVAAPLQQTSKSAASEMTERLWAAVEVEEVQRLVKERAALVATGIYSHGDALIQQLDARIGFLVAEQGTG